MTFPTSSALTGLVAAALLTWLRQRLRRRGATGAHDSTGPTRERGHPSVGASVAAARRWRPADVVALLATLAVGLATRLVGLAARPVDNDEPVALALGSLAAWAESADARLHPPLGGLLFAAAEHGRVDLDAARGVSALAGVGCVALVFAVARSNAGRRAAVVAALLVALAPAALHPSQLARGYALLALGLLAAHVCLSRALESGRERWWTAYSALVALACSTEYLALPVLAAEALVAAWSSRRRSGELVGVIGSFGAGLTLVAFSFPIALPTLWLGIGGGPHEPSGPWRALRDLLDVFSGAAAPFGALLAFAVVAGAAARRRLSTSELRLLVAVITIVVVTVLGGTLTEVRARYALHAFPLLACLVASVALRRFGGLGTMLSVAYGAGHVALLPCYYAGRCHASELSTGRRTPTIEALVAADPLTPVAVTPPHAMPEPSWRLGGVFPGRTARASCKVALCAESGTRRFYGVRPDEVEGLLTAEPRFFLIDREATLGESAACRLAMREADTRLYLCAARPR